MFFEQHNMADREYRPPRENEVSYNLKVDNVIFRYREKTSDSNLSDSANDFHSDSLEFTSDYSPEE